MNNLVALCAIAAGVVSLWQPRHFRTATGVFLILWGVISLGIMHF